MNALLSLIVCIAMLLGTGTPPAVPEEQTVLVMRDLRVTSNGETVDVTPGISLTCALGTSLADAAITLPAEAAPMMIAMRLTQDGTAFLPDGERVFTMSSAMLREKLRLTEDQRKMASAVEPFLVGATETLSTGVIPEDLPARLFDAIARAASVTPADQEITIGNQTFAGRTYDAGLSFATLMAAFDELAAGDDPTAALMKGCLQKTVKADGTPCEKFSDLASADPADVVPLKYTQARVNDVSYDRVSVKSMSGESDAGTLILESVTVKNVGTSAVLTLSLNEGKTSFAYSGKLDLQGTLAEPGKISFTEDMVNVNNTTPDAAVTDKRHMELNAERKESLWSVAASGSLSHAVDKETPSATDFSASCVEAADETGAVVTQFDLSTVSGEKENRLEFEIERTRVPYEDALADCAVMPLSDADDPTTSTVYRLDLEALNADIRAFFTGSKLKAAAELLGIDLDALPLFGEAVEPEATPEPAASVEPTATPGSAETPTPKPTEEPAPMPTEEPYVAPIEETLEEPEEGDFEL